jgi:hypothetical protein
VVERMLQVSGGKALDGVQSDSASLDDAEAAAIDRWVKGLVMKQKRGENAGTRE